MSYKLFRSRDIKSAVVSIFVSLFAVVLTVSAATTISSNVNTGGTLTVSGASTLTGNVTASAALFVAGSEHITTDLFVYGGDINLGTASATSTLTSASGFLGVGTTTPSKFFSVQGNGIFSGDLFSAGLTATGTIAFTGTAATTTLSGGLLVDTSSFIVDFSSNRVGVGTTSPGGLLGISGGTTDPLLLMNQTSTGDILTLQDSGLSVFSVKDGGSVGVGTTTPAKTFSVQGNGLFSGDVTVAGLTATGTVAFNGTAATTTISGGLLVDTTSFMVDFSTNRTGFGTTSPGQEVGVVGDALYSSAATTTVSVQTTSTTIGGCIQLRSVDNKNYRVYAAASTSNSGQLHVELGDCQAQ